MKKRSVYTMLLLVTVMIGICACSTQEQQDGILTPYPSKVVMEDEVWTVLPETQGTLQVCTLSGGKVLKNLVKVGEDALFYCNCPGNVTGGSSKNPVLLCTDPVYDITYYVNYGRDFMIYAERDGISELAVEIPASNLFCRQGELYFIAEDYGSFEFDGMAKGNILKYNPVDGTVEVVVSEKATAMRVYPDVINFYLEMPLFGGGRLEYVNTYSFLNGAIEENPGIDEIDRWKEYGFQLVKGEFQGEVPEELKPNLPYMYSTLGCKFVNQAGEVVGDLPNYTALPEKHLPTSFKIYDDKVYYIEWWNRDASRFVSYDLVTGELSPVIKAELPSGVSDEFIFYQDKIIFGDRICYSLQEKVVTSFFYTNQKRNYNITFFYTDGDQMYGVVDGQLWRMKEVKIDKENQEGRASATIINGCNMAVGEYDYELIVPTEAIVK